MSMAAFSRSVAETRRCGVGGACQDGRVPTPDPITPDTKDWTWVLERPCPECGFDSATVSREELGTAIRENAAGWPPVLGGPAATERPRPDVWSPTEYACHVRDVHLLFAERLEQMLAEDGARFANWDQDATAVEQRYDQQVPGQVASELIAAAERVASVYDDVPDDAWARKGVRSNGDVFTVESLGRYHLHDVVHHLWDVGR
jgi:DinB family protein